MRACVQVSCADLEKIDPAEIREVVGSYKDTGDVKKVQNSGLHIAGERYVVIKADDRSLYGKKVTLLFDHPSSNKH